MSLPTSISCWPTSFALITGKTRQQQHTLILTAFKERASETLLFCLQRSGPSPADGFGEAELAAAHCCGLDLRRVHAPGAGKTEAHECFISCNQREECALPAPRARGPTQEEASQQIFWKAELKRSPQRLLRRPASLSAQRCWHAIKTKKISFFHATSLSFDPFEVTASRLWAVCIKTKGGGKKKSQLKWKNITRAIRMSYCVLNQKIWLTRSAVYILIAPIMCRS